jgi:hypothetical protein
MWGWWNEEERTGDRDGSSPKLMTRMIDDTSYTGIGYRRTPKEAFGQMSME